MTASRAEARACLIQTLDAPWGSPTSFDRYCQRGARGVAGPREDGRRGPASFAADGP